MATEDYGEHPHFHAIDEERLEVARDRAMVEKIKSRVVAMGVEIADRTTRLVERDRVNGYAQLFRTLMEERR